MSTDALSRLSAALSTGPTSTRVTGLGERPLAAPETFEQWTDVVRLAREERWKVLVTGFGSKLGWCPPPERVDLVLSTRSFAGVSSYEPGDGTLTARAGTSLAELSEKVATGGHHLTPDVARPERASLGGVISAGASGVDRLAYGPVRHHLLGTTVCLADGTRTKSGGQLVKNVTGYDLHRLHCGAYGSLCIVLEASLRLYPLPASQAALTRAFATRDEALAAARRVLELAVHPRSVSVDQQATTWRLVVALAGREDVVAWEIRELEEVVESLEVLHGLAAQDLQRTLRDLDSAEGEPALWLAGPPSRLAPSLARVEAAFAGAPSRMLIHPGVASATVVFERLPDATGLTAIETALRGGRVQVRWRNLAHARAGEDLPGLHLMNRLKHALDPDGVFTTRSVDEL